jgi:uncharacterized membrane protein
VVIYLTDILSIVSAFFGILFVLFIPGYALTWAFYPRKEQLELIERIILSFALSISTVSLFIFFMNYVLKISINIFSVFLVIIFLTFLGIAIWYKRSSKKERNLFAIIRGKF